MERRYFILTDSHIRANSADELQPEQQDGAVWACEMIAEAMLNEISDQTPPKERAALLCWIHRIRDMEDLYK